MHARVPVSAVLHGLLPVRGLRVWDQPFGVVDVPSTDAYGGLSHQAAVLRHVNLLIPAVPGVVPRITDWRFKTTPTVLDNLVRACWLCPPRPCFA
jgi:hypothetical protein